MQSLTVFDKGIKYLDACLALYLENCAFFMLYLVGLAWIILKGTKREKQIFVPSAILLIVTVYNPVFPMFLDKIFDVNSEYYRFFWIAPVIILVPYITVKLIMSMDDLKMRACITVMAVVIFIFSGNFLYKNGYTRADNIYKMPAELINISEIIHRDSDQEYPKAFLEYEYNMQMRQYDPKMRLTIDREDYLYAVSTPYTEEMLNDEEFPQYKLLAFLVRDQKVDEDDFISAIEETKTGYIVLDNRNPKTKFLEEEGFELVEDTGAHAIYKTNVYEEPFELVDYSVVYPNEGKSYLYQDFKP